ncbi:MAG: T9SS type A sorting domain-containing protein [Bacteroidales bacterium]|nr:T9SS type A sorting domain-containing protein [Bacteroidales bacterium]
MKTTTRLLAIVAISLFAVNTTAAQCEPDTVNCIDEGNPGEICPRILPEVTVNVPYDEVITVIAPGTFDYQGNQIDIAYIVVDSVLNLPPGIVYFANADKFYPDSAYCIQITGTPTVAGQYSLSIYVTPYIYYLNNIIEATQIVDDTSVVMTVHGPSGIDPYQLHEFQVLPNVPNPFTDITRLGFFTPFDDRIELKVYNILGELMHEEMQGAPPGEHYFQFDGNALLPGTYFYRVANSSRFYTGKFIKSR